jgi:hypothetical protein
MVERHLCGISSDVYPESRLYSPPMQKPIAKRHAMSTGSDGTNTDTKAAASIKAGQAMNTAR